MKKERNLKKIEQGSIFFFNLFIRLAVFFIPGFFIGAGLRDLGGYGPLPDSEFMVGPIGIIWATIYLGGYFARENIISESYLQNIEDGKYYGLFDSCTSLRWKYFVGLRGLQILAILGVIIGLVGLVVVSAYFGGDSGIATKYVTLPLFVLGTLMGFGRMKDTGELVFCHPYAVTRYTL